VKANGVYSAGHTVRSKIPSDRILKMLWAGGEN
jgi:hypothetical protein